MMNNRADNRIVWVFREMRTGGTGFTSSLCGLLGKVFHFIDEDSLDRAKLVPKVVNNTHRFNLIEDVLKRCNPILIRVTRRNKTDQMLSKYAIIHSAKIMPEKAITNIQASTTEEQLAGFNELVRNHPLEIEEVEVIKFAKECLKNDLIWETHESLVESTTVYYEDLLSPMSLPIVDLHKINFLATKNNTLKFPEYKRKLFTNYNQVEKWMEEHYYEHRT